MDESAAELVAQRRRLSEARHAGDILLTAPMAAAIMAVLREHGLTTGDSYYEDHLADSWTRLDYGLMRRIESRLSAFAGVKFRTEDTRRGWRVDCYPEERTPDLDARIAAANVALEALERRLTAVGGEG